MARGQECQLHYFLFSVMQQGGYDYEFVDDPIPQKYVCTICLKVMRQPRLTECCGQHYCDSCLTHWLDGQREKRTCPQCRQEEFQSMLNKEKMREINDLKIYCIHREEGCDQVGALNDLERHLNLENGCGYVEVSCPYETEVGKRCGKIKRKNLPHHMEKKCDYRPYTCGHCGHNDTYCAITSGHYNRCPEFPLECPNKCGETAIKRRAIDNHCKCCPLQVLECPYEGCASKLQRKDMLAHTEEECDYRPYHCIFCGKEDIFQIIATIHLDTLCPMYPLNCPNECGPKKIRRKNMAAHRESCPLELLHCPFRNAGCTEDIARKDMECHMDKNTQKHMIQMFQSHQNLKGENQKLIHENRALKARLETLESRVSDIRSRCHGMRASAGHVMGMRASAGHVVMGMRASAGQKKQPTSKRSSLS